MDFKSIDWDAEAFRVLRAFGYRGRSKWLGGTQAKTIRFIPKSEYMVLITYSVHGRIFDLASPGAHIITIVADSWDGKFSQTRNRKFQPIIVKAFYHLGLLSPDVENALGVTITGHQKMEWTLENEQKWGVYDT